MFIKRDMLSADLEGKYNQSPLIAQHSSAKGFISSLCSLCFMHFYEIFGDVAVKSKVGLDMDTKYFLSCYVITRQVKEMTVSTLTVTSQLFCVVLIPLGRRAFCSVPDCDIQFI